MAKGDEVDSSASLKPPRVSPPPVLDSVPYYRSPGHAASILCQEGRKTGLGTRKERRKSLAVTSNVSGPPTPPLQTVPPFHGRISRFTVTEYFPPPLSPFHPSVFSFIFNRAFTLAAFLMKNSSRFSSSLLSLSSYFTSLLTYIVSCSPPGERKEETERTQTPPSQRNEQPRADSAPSSTKIHETMNNNVPSVSWCQPSGGQPKETVGTSTDWNHLRAALARRVNPPTRLKNSRIRAAN